MPRTDLLVALCGTFSLIVLGQTTKKSTQDGTTPPGQALGSPIGSFKFSDFDTISPFTGKLNVRLPLLTVRGRGEAAVTIHLGIESFWRTTQNIDCVPQSTPPVCNTSFVPDHRPWTEEQLKLRYNPGTVLARVGGEATGSSQCPNTASVTLTRFTFTDSTGSETELIDKKTSGQPKQWGCAGGTHDRRRVFESIDGSAMTFVATNAVVEDNSTWQLTYRANGSLYLADGTQYVITNGKVTLIRDRNGNQIEFTYRPDTGVPAQGELASIRDNLDRTYTFTYHEASGLSYDTITYSGFAGTSRIIKVYWNTLGNLLRDGGTVQTLKQLFPESDVSAGGNPFNPEQVEKVALPGDTLLYTFRYNPYGEVSRITTPLGGGFEYDYVAGMGSGSGFRTEMVYRRVASRRTYSSFPGTPRLTTTFGTSHVSSPEQLEVTTTDYEGSSAVVLAQSTSKLYGLPTQTPPSAADYSWWKSAREFETLTAGLRKVTKTWAIRMAFPFTTGTTGREGGIDPRLTQEDTRYEDDVPPITSTAEYEYDEFNNRTVERIRDFDGTTVLRTISTGYLAVHPTNSVDYARVPLTALGDIDTSKPLVHIRRQVRTQAVSGPNGNPATTTNEFDVYTPDARHAALASVGTVPLFSPPSHEYRGNVTGITRSNTPANITENQLFDNAGNVVKQFDGESGETTITFSDTFKRAYPTERSVKVDTTTFLVTKFGYDFSTGLLTNRTDPHTLSGFQETYDYTDEIDRLKTFVQAPGTTAALSTTFDYSNIGTVDNYIKTTSSTTSCGTSLPIESRIYFDGLGRRIRTAAYRTVNTAVQTQTEYDGLSRIKRVSNPYDTENPTAWTENAYDLLGRLTKITLQDGSVSRVGFRSNKTYQRDPAGVWKKELRDSLGRLSAVTEAPTISQSLADLLFPGQGVTARIGDDYVSSYTYDARANLRSVVQGTQTRTFAFDEVNRLTSATNPESGTITYSYYATGSLKTRIDANGVTTTHFYDPANRPTKRTYSNGDETVITCYGDGNASGDCAGSPIGAALKGRLTMVKRGSLINKYSAYDPMGRVLASSQEETPGLGVFAFAYVYTTSGWLAEQTYPSQRKVSMCYNALGQATRVTNGPSSGSNHYASSVTYAPHGAPASITLGNTLVEATEFNSRLQPTLITAMRGVTKLLGLSYGYGGGTNNGNLQSQVISFDSVDGAPSFSETQSYPTYDAMNRLVTAQTTAWTQTNGYDRFGNRWVPDHVNLPDLKTQTPRTSSWFIERNRINYYPPGHPNTPADAWQYDAAGNLKSIPSMGRTFAYDAENRQKAATVDSISTQYLYDGEGRRVKRFTSNESTFFVYDAAGQLASEYGGASEPGLTYLTADHLGSTRLLTSAAGVVKKRYDYLPFGEEIPAGYGGRTETMGYGSAHSLTLPDKVTNKFTGKERDAETGLDYFGARYFSAAQGRWTSPDWADQPEPLPYADLRDPQTFNLYGYGRNSPLSNRDVDGHFWQELANFWKWGHWVDNAHLEGALQRQADEARKSLAQMKNFTVGGKTPQELAQVTSNQQVVATYRQVLESIAAEGLRLCPPDVLCGVGPMIGGRPVFRGGTSLVARPGIDVKVGADGLVRPGRGISVSLDPKGLDRFGGARQVVSMPDELQLVQRGSNASHYEIAPKQPMTLQRFQELLGQVKLKE